MLNQFLHSDRPVTAPAASDSQLYDLFQYGIPPKFIGTFIYLFIYLIIYLFIQEHLV